MKEMDFGLKVDGKKSANPNCIQNSSPYVKNMSLYVDFSVANSFEVTRTLLKFLPAFFLENLRIKF